MTAVSVTLSYLLCFTIIIIPGSFQQRAPYLTIKGSSDYDGCLCPGDRITYECKVVGGNSVVWRGSALSCNSSNNEITLTNNFSSTIVCNNGNIIGKILIVANKNVTTSQLDVTLTREIVDKNIECFSDNGTHVESVGLLNISDGLCIAPLLTDVMEINGTCQESETTFNWSPFITNCSILHYAILSSNCGSCPTTTTNTTVTCTDVPSDGGVCRLHIHAVMCGNESSDALSVSMTRHSVFDQTECHAGDAGVDKLRLILAITLPLTVVVLLILAAFILNRICFKQNCFIHTSQSNLNSVTFHMKLQQGTQSIQEEKHEIECAYNYTNVAIKVFDNSMDGVYGIDDLPETEYKAHCRSDPMKQGINLDSLVLNLQGRVSSQWYQFGSALGVPEKILNQLVGYSDKDALVEVLDYWLKHHSYQPSWSEIRDAIIKCAEE